MLHNDDAARRKDVPGTVSPVKMFAGIRPLCRGTALRDALAGVSLASMIIPQVLGYTRIAGTPGEQTGSSGNSPMA